VESSDEVSSAQDRLVREGLATAWRADHLLLRASGQGVGERSWGEPWEIYTVLADAEMSGEMLRSEAPGEAVCCGTHPELGAIASGATSCC